MPLWRRRKADAGPPDDISADMRAMGQDFVDWMNRLDIPLGWEPWHAGILDDLCDLLVSKLHDNQDDLQIVRLSMGAYLGELLVRHHKGQWRYDHENRTSAIDMPGGLTAHPHAKVEKRMELGREHSLVHFYQFAAFREVPPDAQVHIRSDTAGELGPKPTT